MRALPRVLAVVAVTLVTLGLPATAAACPVCFGEASGPMAEALNNGVLFMLGIVAAVQFGFVALFVGIWRRSRRLREHEESPTMTNGGMN